MTFPEAVLREVRRLCLQSPRAEVCGIIDTADRVLPVRNAARDPERHFVFDRREFCAAVSRIRRDGDGVKAYYHTHPCGSAAPSRADQAYVAKSRVPALIVSRHDYTVVVYEEP